MVLMNTIRALALLTAGLTATSAHAVLSWANCADVKDTDFRAVTLVTRAGDKLEEPMKMAFDLLAAPGEDAGGKVDVYFTERMGNVRKYDSKTGKVLTLATFNMPLVSQANSSDGVLGIALDPDFKANNQVYLYYSYLTDAEKDWRVSRFTLSAAHDKLNLSSEVIIIKIPIHGGSKHPGGAIQFDAYKDLWITTGNDYYIGDDFPVWSSANTDDLRGKILRIHPLPQGGYTVPAGNLFPSGLAHTKPEIYVMGTRNPYTLTLDPVRRWALWGDVGPDGKDMDGMSINGTNAVEKTEEYDLAQAPGNYGYPFFAGDTRMKSGIDAAGPVIPANTVWKGYTPGLSNLPAAVAPIYAYHKSCAITGPLYRYDGDLKSSVKFPPHFQRKWLVSDFSGSNQKVKVLTLDGNGKKVTAEEPIPGIALKGPLDIQFGPDGALYVSNYGGVWRAAEANTSLVRYEYTGTCRPSEPKIETPTSTSFQAARNGLASWQSPRVDISQANGLSISVATAGRYTVDVRDLAGRTVAIVSAQGPAPVSLAVVHPAGIYFLHVKSQAGVQVIKIVRD